MNKNEKYFLNSLRCVLFLLVTGAYNSGYEVRPSARGSPKLLLLVATSHIRKPLYEMLERLTLIVKHMYINNKPNKKIDGGKFK